MVRAVRADSVRTPYGLRTDLWSPYGVRKDRWGTVKYSQPGPFLVNIGRSVEEQPNRAHGNITSVVIRIKFGFFSNCGS
jgi:hypothetical protein